jgi:hypothetical protein
MTAFVAHLTQYMRPNGTPKQVDTDLPIEVQPLYEDMQKNDCFLECEVLTNGHVSVTVTNADQDVDISITPNGPEVQQGIAAMLKRQLWITPA